jgi:hypothetical protein
MHRIIQVSVILVLCGAIGAVALSQEEERAPAEKADVKALIERLGHSDYAERKKAEEELLALGPDAVAGLEEAKRGHPDAHVRFEAERLLARIAEQGEKELAERPRGEGRLSPRGNEYIDEMLRRMEEQGLLGDEYLERLRESLERSQANLLPGINGAVSGVIRNGDRQIKWQRGMDGKLRVEVTRDGETETYEADSLEDLKEKAPEVYEELAPHLNSFRIRVGPPGDDWWREFEERSRRMWEKWFDGPRSPLRRGARTPWSDRFDRPDDPPAGFRLGVWVFPEIPEVLREHLGLPPGDGVLVEDVVPGSLADRLGLKRMDILRTLNGEKVTSANSIRAIISTLADGAQVEAQIIRRGQPLKLVSSK